MEQTTDAAAFDAARKRFIDAAAKSAGRKAAALEVEPETPGDHFEEQELGVLRTGALRAWRAGDERDLLVAGFASPDEVAVLPAGLTEALRAGRAVDEDAPGLAALFAAAKLGAADALPYAEVRKRLEFMFHFAKLGRLCPITSEGDTVRLRWQLSVTDGSANTPRGPAGARRTVKTHQPWLTATYDRAAGTARLVSGDQGC